MAERSRLHRMLNDAMTPRSVLQVPSPAARASAAFAARMTAMLEGVERLRAEQCSLRRSASARRIQRSWRVHSMHRTAAAITHAAVAAAKLRVDDRLAQLVRQSAALVSSQAISGAIQLRTRKSRLRRSCSARRLQRMWRKRRTVRRSAALCFSSALSAAVRSVDSRARVVVHDCAAAAAAASLRAALAATVDVRSRQQQLRRGNAARCIQRSWRVHSAALRLAHAATAAAVTAVHARVAALLHSTAQSAAAAATAASLASVAGGLHSQALSVASQTIGIAVQRRWLALRSEACAALRRSASARAIQRHWRRSRARAAARAVSAAALSQALSSTTARTLAELRGKSCAVLSFAVSRATATLASTVHAAASTAVRAAVAAAADSCAVRVRRHRAASTLQAAARGKRARVQFARVCCAAATLQQGWRRALQRAQTRRAPRAAGLFHSSLSSPAAVSRLAADMMAAVDVDGSGSLALSELQACLAPQARARLQALPSGQRLSRVCDFLAASTDLRALLQRLDADGNGSLSCDELTSLLAEALHSSSTPAPPAAGGAVTVLSRPTVISCRRPARAMSAIVSRQPVAILSAGDGSWDETDGCWRFPSALSGLTRLQAISRGVAQRQLLARQAAAAVVLQRAVRSRLSADQRSFAMLASLRQQAARMEGQCALLLRTLAPRAGMQRRAALVICRAARRWLLRRALRRRVTSRLLLQRSMRAALPLIRVIAKRRCATAIAAAYRGSRQRRRFRLQRSAVRTLQAALRCWLARRRAQHRAAAVTRIAAAARGSAARRAWQRCRAAVLRLQRAWRKFCRRRRHHAATLLQAHVRGAAARTFVSRKRVAIVVCQSAVRMFLARCSLRRAQAASSCIAAAFRGCRERRRFASARRGVTLLQAHVRGRLCRSRFVSQRAARARLRALRRNARATGLLERPLSRLERVADATALADAHAMRDDRLFSSAAFLRDRSDVFAALTAGSRPPGEAVLEEYVWERVAGAGPWAQSYIVLFDAAKLLYCFASEAAALAFLVGEPLQRAAHQFKLHRITAVRMTQDESRPQPGFDIVTDELVWTLCPETGSKRLLHWMAALRLRAGLHMVSADPREAALMSSMPESQPQTPRASSPRHRPRPTSPRRRAEHSVRTTGKGGEGSLLLSGAASWSMPLSLTAPTRRPHPRRSPQRSRRPLSPPPSAAAADKRDSRSSDTPQRGRPTGTKSFGSSRAPPRRLSISFHPMPRGHKLLSSSSSALSPTAALGDRRSPSPTSSQSSLSSAEEERKEEERQARDERLEQEWRRRIASSLAAAATDKSSAAADIAAAAAAGASASSADSSVQFAKRHLQLAGQLLLLAGDRWQRAVVGKSGQLLLLFASEDALAAWRGGASAHSSSISLRAATVRLLPAASMPCQHVIEIHDARTRRFVFAADGVEQLRRWAAALLSPPAAASPMLSTARRPPATRTSFVI
eukprot:PLAT11344.3.p1 GENE.PLAT11344.3~~PLAT11344.3.p1  ORF type:complete len:1619 (+),score=679.58 PLAT11344.3:497-4858(+)